MHEYSIVQALIAKIHGEARARGATSVARVRIAIGELSGVEPDLLVKAYSLFREKTICAGADLEVRHVPARWVCPSCDTAIEPGTALRCPSCAFAARLAAGDEILLEQIEMEVPDVRELRMR